MELRTAMRCEHTSKRVSRRHHRGRRNGPVDACGRKRAAIALGALGLWLAAAPVAIAEGPEAANQCVRCHDSQRLPIALGHSFEEWRVSSHASVGVGCEKCHGGDPSAGELERAHRGVRAARDPQSRVHPRNLAATCGACHQPESEAYSRTVHSKQVQESNTGATCMTCHGSMAASLPSPAALGARCAACHQEPLQAHVALVMLAQAKIDLHRAAELIEKVAASQSEWHAEAAERLQSLERDYAALALTWHTFDMEKTTGESRAILKLVDLLEEEARLRLERGH
ncbi:MAG: cytochrome c3 family protein [Myxococcota bacterium]